MGKESGKETKGRRIQKVFSFFEYVDIPLVPRFQYKSLAIVVPRILCPESLWKVLKRNRRKKRNSLKLNRCLQISLSKWTFGLEMQVFTRVDFFREQIEKSRDGYVDISFSCLVTK